jgi:ABC-2 type transport system permease protein
VNNFIFGLKREYWEYKRLLISVPIIFAIIFFLMAIAATWTYDLPTTEFTGVNSELEVTDNNKNENFWFSGVYLAGAWLAALFYALSCLFRDRRDKSILYWKTMPVSELQNILNKYLFAVVGFSIIAVVASWISAATLIAYAYLMFPPEMMPGADVGMSFEKLVVWPFFAIFIALFWCAPVFAIALYVSSRTNRMPILTLLVPVALVFSIEKIIFRSNEIRSFLFAHSPFGLLEKFAHVESTSELLKVYLVDSMPSLILGLLIAFVFFWRTAWRRDHCFEI